MAIYRWGAVRNRCAERGRGLWIWQFPPSEHSRCGVREGDWQLYTCQRIGNPLGSAY